MTFGDNYPTVDDIKSRQIKKKITIDLQQPNICFHGHGSVHIEAHQQGKTFVRSTVKN